MPQYLDNDGNPISADAPDPAGTLQGAVSYGATQDPDKYAHLLDLQKRIGIPPAVSTGNEQQVQHAADVNSIDYPKFAAANPRTTTWASNPDNAAVSGVGEVQRLGGIEQNAASMRAYSPTGWDWVTDKLQDLGTAMMGGTMTKGQLRQNFWQGPLTRGAADVASGVAGMAGNIGSALGWHGDGPSKQNLLQRVESSLDPANQGDFSNGQADHGNQFDSLMKNIAPMIPAVLATGGAGLLADTLGLSSKATKVLQGLTVGGMFDLDQGGKTYTAVAGSGGSDDAARLAASRVMAISALPNALFGATDVVPLLRDNPLLTSLGLGGATGAAGQVGQNVVTGQPWSKGVGSAAVQGAAAQGGMHLGMGAFGGHMEEAVSAAEQSKLRERSPEKFDEAMQTIFSGDASLRVPADQFNAYFKGKGMDPAAVASGLRSTNYAEAHLSGGDVEIPPADFLSKLDPEHQKALLPDIVDPASGLTARQHQEGLQELQEWATGGGAEKLAADTAAADAETASTPEYQDVKEQLRQRYVDAGETPEVAETLAAKDANAYSNLARNAGMKPSELLSLYNPKVMSGEAPEGGLPAADGGNTDVSNHTEHAPTPAGQEADNTHSLAESTLHQKAVDDIRSVVQASKEEGHAPQKAVIAPVHSWMVEAAKDNGLDIEGYNHVIDGSAIRHAINRHGDEAIETSRGQLPISEADFDRIPDIIDSPDQVVLGTKTRGHKDQIGYMKRLEDGTTLYLEEARTGKKELATVSMRKYPATKDFGDIADTLPSNARGDGGNKPIIVQPPSVDKTDILHQSAPNLNQPRGWFRVLPDGSYEIGKTKIGDLSTFVHEPAHAYLKILGNLSKREGATQWLKNDYQKVLDFLGAKDGEPLTREQQETWARANEQYLREGKAPSTGMRGVFQNFAVWLGRIYKKASDLGVDLSDDIRGVFDRLYAAEEGVNKAEADAGPKMFTTPEEAGWTEEQFQKYADDNNVSVADAKAHVMRELSEAAARDQSQSWRDEVRNVRQAMAEQIDASPEYKAIRGLRKGELEDGTPLTLSKESLVEKFGEDRVSELQKLHRGIYRNEGGVDAETAAELHGFSSADEMMRTLEATPRRDAAIDQATRDYMTAKHGDIRFDGTLDSKALLALESKRGDGLYRELKALKAKVGKMEGQRQALRDITVAPLDAYREAAHQMIERKAVADLNPTRHLDASRKYSREAFDALRKGDAAKAAEAKHKELMNHFLFREATEAKEYVGKVEDYAKRAQGRTVQSNLGLAGSDYRAQFNKLLFRFGLSGLPAEMPERPLSEWADDVFEQGKEPALDPTMYDESRGATFRKMSVAEVRSLHDALKNIKALAYQEMHAVVNGRKIDFADAKSAMIARARESIKSKPEAIFPEDRSTSEKAWNLVDRGMAPLIRTEFLMKRLDGGVEGPWHDNLWNLAADAQGVERELQEGVTKVIGDTLHNMPDDQRMRMLDKVNVPGWGETTRKRLISMALNMGNEGNLDRLRKTFEAFKKDPAGVDQIPQMLSREDWQLVQGIWDSLKPMGARMNEMERRLTGLPPAMVTPTPLHIKFADGSEMDLAGGYYPIVMDPRYSERAQQQDVNATARNMMESGYGRASTSRGYTKERTGFAGRLLLDHEQVLTQHIAKASKDISHREFILAANRFLQDREVQQTLRETVGQGFEAQMMPWLRTIVNDRNGSAVQGLGDLSNWMGQLRTNVVQASLGFKLSTLLLQITHAPTMFLHTSPGAFASALGRFLAHPNEMTQQIRDLSPNEMKNRGENIDRDMRKVLQDGIEGRTVGKVVAKAAMFPVKMMDHLMSFPLWQAVYDDAMAKRAQLPIDEAKYQAMHKADGAVRMGLGANAPKDLPAVMRKNDFWKMVTMLGGFENLKLNQFADASYGVAADRRAGASRAATAGSFTYRMLMAAAIPAVLGAYVTGNRPKDDQNPAEWAAQRALFFPPETLPGLGSVGRAWEEHSDAKFSPFIDVLQKAVRAGNEATSDKEDKDWTGIGLNAGEAAGQLAGVPGTVQAARILRYTHRAQMGEIDDPNTWDAVAGSAPRK